MTLSLISAVARNQVIGKGNDLPWKIPEDLKYFKSKTSGCPIIMGRRTFESIGSRPLPKRLNIVLSRSEELKKREDIEVYPTLEEALSSLRDRSEYQDKEVFIVGGARVYAESLRWVDRLYLTEVDEDFEGDTYFPSWPQEEFQEVSREEREGEPPYAFVVYERKK